MGRSVMTLSNATAIAYDYMEPDEEFYRERFNEDVEEGFKDEDDDFEQFMWNDWNDFGAQSDFEAILDSTQYILKELWPSFEDADEWVERECHVIAQNAHSIVTISEYCGSIAICLGARYDRDDYYADSTELANLGEHWRKQIADKFEQTFGGMRKLGTFSNGESIYEKIGA
jgi:hypothetical protein